MPFTVHVRSPRVAAAAAAGAALLIAAGAYFISDGEPGSDRVVAPLAASASAPRARAQTAADLPGEPGTAPAASAATLPLPVPPFTREAAAHGLRAFVDKIVSGHSLSAEELDEFQHRLLVSIEDNPDIANVVAQFYHNMPAEQAMERDMLRSLLVVSAAGRGLVLQEANAIWQDQSVAKFGEMYETYFNLPGQAPQDVLGRALADLKAGAPADTRTAVARLNFIGTLAEQSNGDTANLRSDAALLLNQVAASAGSEVVRGLAVQKLYRLNSPAEASNIAVAQLAKGAYSDLVRETLNSVSSGDVELTPTLRSALATAVQRPSASTEEKQQWRQVMDARGTGG